MISARRIVTIFLRRGGSGEFTKTADELTSSQVAHFQDRLEGQTPLIASMRSADEWFALSDSQVASERLGMFRRIRLNDMEGVISPVGGRGFNEGKKHGGVVEVRLKDGSTLPINAESGGPFVALTNVFMYLTRVNRQRQRTLTG
jgi:hypothetical protein